MREGVREGVSEGGRDGGRIRKMVKYQFNWKIY